MIKFRLLAIVLLLASCAVAEEEKFGANQGTLSLGSFGITVDGAAAGMTKALAVPSSSQFTLDITAEDGSVIYSGSIIYFSAPKGVPAGTYTLTAYYGNWDESAAIGSIPCYKGTAQATVTPGAMTSVNMSASLSVAAVELVFPDNWYDCFGPGCTMTVESGSESQTVSAENAEQNTLYVRDGAAVSVSLSGQTTEGAPIEKRLQENMPVRKGNYYKINCNLPILSMPEQTAGVWSHRVYLTELTAQNVTLTGDDGNTAAKESILPKVTYEYSTDGTAWNPAVSGAEGWVVTGLAAGTECRLRARYGNIVSSPVTVTTEAEQQIANSNMETWGETEVKSLYGAQQKLILYYLTPQDNPWATRNPVTTGYESGGTASTDNAPTLWRHCSNTVPTSTATEGSKAAEISTMAFYRAKYNVWFDSRSKVRDKLVSGGTAYTGYLFTGSLNANGDSSFGTPHEARPDKISFDYKYTPVSGDQCIAYAEVYDSNGTRIASTDRFASGQQDAYTTQTLPLTYTTRKSKAAKIVVYFQSGTDTDISKMSWINGSYSATPYSHDKLVGSTLLIDNVKLIYE